MSHTNALMAVLGGVGVGSLTYWSLNGTLDELLAMYQKRKVEFERRKRADHDPVYDMRYKEKRSDENIDTVPLTRYHTGTMTPTEQTQYWRNRVYEYTNMRSDNSTKIYVPSNVPMNQVDMDAVCQNLRELGWSITTCTGKIVAEHGVQQKEKL